MKRKRYLAPYREEYVRENKVMCENHSNRYAYGTAYDINWDEHEYCKECFEKWDKETSTQGNTTMV